MVGHRRTDGLHLLRSLKLARFNATVALVPKDAAGKSNYFEKLPIQSSLFLVRMLSYWQWKEWTIDAEGIPLGQVTLLGKAGGDGDMHLVSFIFAAWAVEMVRKTLLISKLRDHLLLFALIPALILLDSHCFSHLQYFTVRSDTETVFRPLQIYDHISR